MDQQPRARQGPSDTSQAAKQQKCLVQLTWVSCNHKVVELDMHHDLLQDRNCKVSYISLVNNALQSISAKLYATSLLQKVRQYQAHCQTRRKKRPASNTRWGARGLTAAKPWILLTILQGYVEAV